MPFLRPLFVASLAPLFGHSLPRTFIPVASLVLYPRRLFPAWLAMDAVQKETLLTAHQPHGSSVGLHTADFSSGASLVLAEELLNSVCRRIANASCLADVKAVADEASAAAELVSRARRVQAPDPERVIRQAKRRQEMRADQAARNALPND